MPVREARSNNEVAVEIPAGKDSPSLAVPRKAGPLNLDPKLRQANLSRQRALTVAADDHD